MPYFDLISRFKNFREIWVPKLLCGAAKIKDAQSSDL